MKNYVLVYKDSAKKDFDYIYDSVTIFSGSEDDARYVIDSLRAEVQVLTNPYFKRLIPYSSRIAQLGFFYYPLLGGTYIVFFKVNSDEMIKEITYVKSTRMDYLNLVK